MTQPCVCTTVRKADRALFRLYEMALAPTGMTVTQFSILRQLQRQGATPLSRLADQLVMERTSLYRTIRPLEANGCVALDELPENRKIRVAALTQTGEERLAEVTPYWQRAQTRMIDQLGADNWAALSESLLALPGLVGQVERTA
jgi:DNA-binding MarR family transcriptional regulator